MVQVTAPVEDNLSDTPFQRFLGQEAAYLASRFLIAGFLQFPTQFRVQRGGGNQGVASRVIYDLGVDVFQTAIHAETRTLWRAENALPNA
jgi:hypothetical protein